MGSQWILSLVLVLALASCEPRPRVRRSLSCRLGEAGCKWSCRLRGYIRGRCGEDNACQCTERVSATALMRYFSDKWSDKFPDLGVISNMMEAILQRNDSTCDKTRSDGKWRPFPLLLGALFKAHEDVNMDESPELVTERGDDEMMSVLGHFWHLITAADTILRPGLSDAETEAEVRNILEVNKGKYAERIGIKKEDVVWVWSAELDRASDHVSQHVPDHVVTTHHKERQVILTLLGTRVWPHPQALDIMMDLMATTRPYLGGLAHSGLAQGAANIVSTAGPVIRAELARRPGYELLIIGYSLGAGLAQLIALDCELGECGHMMPRDRPLRVLGYGSPPVFTPAPHSPVPQLDNVILVTNREDGIGGLSLNNLHEVLHQVCLVENLNIRRRDLLRLLFSDPDEESKDYINLVEKMDSEDSVAKEGKQYEIEIIEFQAEDSHNHNTDDENNKILSSIKKELSNATLETDEPELYHIGSTLILLERKNPDLKSFSLSEHHGLNATTKFSNNLHLRPSMLVDHLPDGYSSLFHNVGNFGGTELNNAQLNVSVLDKLMKQKHNSQSQKKRGKWGRFKTNVKNFFKGIG